MLQSLKTYFANQARHPSGLFGKWIAPRVFNKENRQMEDLGLQMMQPDGDDHILEIGFGNGRLLSEIVPKINRGKVYGIDISEEMIQLAAKRNRDWIEKDKLEIKKASVSKIPYPDNQFDKIFTANTIYFWPEPEQDLLEIRRVLKSGGKFICGLRFSDQLNSISVIRDNPDIFQNLYNETGVRQLFNKAGFNQIRFETRSEESDQYCVATALKSNQ